MQGMSGASLIKGFAIVKNGWGDIKVHTFDSVAESKGWCDGFNAGVEEHSGEGAANTPSEWLGEIHDYFTAEENAQVGKDLRAAGYTGEVVG